MILKVENVYKSYKKKWFFSNKYNTVLNDISFSMNQKECLGIIGESGSGKSTLARLILGIERPDKGHLYLNGKQVNERKNRRGVISAVFQDYTSSIAPNSTIYDTIAESARISGKNISYDEAEELLRRVGLTKEYLMRYPHELSGGEIQRACIARAISYSPKLIVLDEAISSLDASIQVAVLELLKKLQKDFQLSYLFITHDIQAATYICDRLIIFKDGRIVEEVETKNINRVKEDYSKKLFNAVLTV